MEQIRELKREVFQSQRAADFIEHTRIHVLAKLENKSHEWVAHHRSHASSTVLDLIERGAVALGATTDPGALGILQNLAQAYLGSVGLFSGFQQIWDAGGTFLKVPLRSRVVSVTAAGSGHVVSEIHAKPITKLDLKADQTKYFKSVGIVALSNEVWRSISSAAANLISDELGRAVGYASDQAFIDVLTDSTGAPSTPSSGASAAAFVSDLQSARAQIHYGSTSKLFLIVPPGFYSRHLALMRDSGGWILTNDVIQDISVVQSDVLTDTAILLDSTQIAAANEMTAVVTSDTADLQLDDNPTSGLHLTSLFMENMIAAKAERFISCEVLRDDALCLLTGVAATA